MSKYSVVDLFAGAGGLSLGFIQTNKYNVKVAFENNPNMQKTYKKNHPSVEMRGNVCEADYNEIVEKYGTIDVVIGGPPCQGFSNANRQKNQAICKNNMLVKQYVRAITELQPKAFVMENVGMLRSEVHRFYMEEGDDVLINKYRIPVRASHIVLLEQDYYFDGALEIIGNLDQIHRYLWTERAYAELNIIYKITKNPTKLKETLAKHKEQILRLAPEYTQNDQPDYIVQINRAAFLALENYYNGKEILENINSAISPAIMIQRMLSKAKEIFDNRIIVDEFNIQNGIVANIRSFAVYDYIKCVLSSSDYNYTITSNVLCAADYGAPQKRMRFVVMGIRSEYSSTLVFPKGSFNENEYRTVRDAIEDLEECNPVFELTDDIGIPLQKTELGDLGKQLRNSELLHNHIITKTTETALKRFKALSQGQNFHSLDNSLKTNTYTDIARTQNTIYLRLNYDEPCGTVVNVRKSMWIHPTKDRAISIREAARLQTFPDSFIFCGTKDQQYQQVGNAVPPIMSKAIAKKLAKLLDQVSEKKKTEM